MEEITLSIDGKELTVQKGLTILEAALQNNIYIPHLCHHPDLAPAGVCRLCYVDIEGEGAVLSCRMPAGQGMAVKTRTPELDALRCGIVELLVANHHEDCRNCPKTGRCELQKIIAYLRLDRKKAKRLRPAGEEVARDTANPFFDLDSSKCVLCGRCVRTCAELMYIDAINIVGRGHWSRVAPSGGGPLARSSCESCGECVERCPVGALTYKEYRRPREYVATVCPHCDAGCRLTLGLRDGQIVAAQGSPLCARGRFGWRYVYAPDRLTVPAVKKDGEFRETSWEEAIRLVAGKLLQYKGEEFALITTARVTNEEAYLIQKFARQVMGTNNIDNTARLTLGDSLPALWEATGAGAATNSLAAIENAGGILLAGTNLTKTHPMIARQVKKAATRGSKLIIIDPVENDLYRFAHLWLKPYPGTDLALLMGMAGVIIEEGLLDTRFIEERCSNFAEFQESLADFPPGRVERITGVPREMIAEAARIFAASKPAGIFWSTGITQYAYGRDTVQALINLALLTGNVGGASSGLYPLGGQSNAQGVGDMGCLPDFYPGYHPVVDEEARKKFGTAWQADLSPEAGLSLTNLWDAVLEGKVKCLYVIGANPARDMADARKIRKCLEKVEFLVVQDLFWSETADYADVVLSAASFAEKEGTFTSIDRRVQKVGRAINPVGQTLPDGEIISKIAREMGAVAFHYHPAEILAEIASLVPIYQGISAGWGERGAFVWPAGKSVLHREAFLTPRGKGKFIPLEYRAPLEQPDFEYPLILITRRNTIYSGACAHKVVGLASLAPKEYLEVNPKDAADFEINNEEEIRVASRHGEIKITVQISEDVPPGVVVLNYNSPRNSRHLLTRTEMKACAVQLRKK